MIQQAACVPFRESDDGYEILLITTRKGKWSLPKGIIDPGETPEQTACKEAFEEAGIEGVIEGGSIGSFIYHKWGETLQASVFLLHVKKTHRRFQEQDFRKRAWLTPCEAKSRIRRRMRKVVTDAVMYLDEQFRS